MENNIEYKFVRMILRRFELSEENIPADSSNIECNVTVRFNYKERERVISCTVFVDLSYEGKACATIAFTGTFEISEESEKNLEEGDKITFPVPVLAQFASLCYGSLRGVFFMETARTSLCNYILPPLYLNDVIKDPFIVKR